MIIIGSLLCLSNSISQRNSISQSNEERKTDMQTVT